jgi:glycosyltransferase involved in cell wall biosynthesis
LQPIIDFYSSILLNATALEGLFLSLGLFNVAQLLQLQSIGEIIMKVLMVNDCAYVGETLIKYLPSEINVIHLKRTRGYLDKTLRIFWKVFRSKGDLYHVHYLLQDCYMALKLGKHPLIGHAHGSDLREVIRSKKWGWIVKYNLKNCDKVLVAQPTILNVAREFNETAEYLPIPYDPEIFYPNPLPKEHKIKRVFLASAHDFRIKGTDKLLKALAKVDVPIEVKTIKSGKDSEKAERLAKNLGLKVEFIDKVPHNEMNKLFWESDLVLGSFGIGQLDTVAIEAMACGRPVVHHILKGHYPFCPLEEISSVEEIFEYIMSFLTDYKEAKKRVQAQLKYVTSVHSARLISRKLVKVYQEHCK